ELQAQLLQQQQALHQAQRSLCVHQELATAFGRNGLQALLIEHLLPQLEAETNHLLGRLSAHQLHVQFVTQRAGRSRQSKLIDTLDIVIADAQGTRPYETYSGGEAFRVNFAIRLALARLLAQRSGTPLQMLIIDEGFGTQDREGCDRLVGAINAIAADFACILAVTHIPHFREAFETRIDVVKTPEGSQLDVSM
ncbi:MAG TPA: SbcC/MukB-like Walker B domain-containing protein, partial [Candidatus Obscuribacterales bacterium]